MKDKAFRERLAQSLNRLRKNVYLSHAVPKRLSPAHYEDLVRVKLAYMDEHPVDDDEPLDNAWTSKVADHHGADLMGQPYQEFGSHYYEDSGDIKEPVLRRRLRGEVCLDWVLVGDCGDLIVCLNKEPETRGDLRRLCAALNIELKED